MTRHENAWRALEEFALQVHIEFPLNEEQVIRSASQKHLQAPAKERIKQFIVPMSPGWFERAGGAPKDRRLPPFVIDTILRRDFSYLVRSLWTASLHKDKDVAGIASGQLYHLADLATRYLELLASERPDILEGCATDKASAPGRMRAVSQPLFESVDSAYRKAVGLSGRPDVDLARPEFANPETIYALWLVQAARDFHSVVRLVSKDHPLDQTLRRNVWFDYGDGYERIIYLPDEIGARLSSGDCKALNSFLGGHEGLLEHICMALSASLSGVWLTLSPLVNERNEDGWDIRAPAKEPALSSTLSVKITALQYVSSHEAWAKTLLQLLRCAVPDHQKTGDVQRRIRKKTLGSDFGKRFREAVNILLPSNPF